jgi:hypothetical protein
MQSQERGGIAPFLSEMVSAGASSQEVAEIFAAAFRGLEQTMLHLARPACAWLPATPEGSVAAMDVAALTTELAKQSASDAADAGTRLLQILCALLNSLIGASLTARLLGPVWTTFLSGPSARDIKS